VIYSFVAVNPYYALGTMSSTLNPHFPDAYFTQANLLSGVPRVEQLQYKMDQPTVFKYSLDIQRAITNSTSFDIGGSATRAWHLMRVTLANPRVAPTVKGRLLITPTAPFIDPAFGRLRPKQTDGLSSYYALQMQLNQRAAKGLMFRVAYTFSKATDTASSFAGTTDFTNEAGAPRYLGMQENGLSAFDIRQVLTTNFNYDLPGSSLTGLKGSALGGWQVSGILTVQGGNPFAPRTGMPPSQFTDVQDYPDVIAGSSYKYDTRNPNQYFDPSPFAIPGLTVHDAGVAHTGIIGNAGRNILIGPGLATMNLVLAKRFRLRENTSLQFRSEFYNFLNRANFSQPGTTGAAIFDANTLKQSTSAGQIQNTTGSARELQFALRLEF
jgi:hypothetical protein